MLFLVAFGGQMWTKIELQNRTVFEVFGVPGPVWAHRALRVDSESQNGAQEVKMGGKIGSNGIKFTQIVA